MSWFKEFSQTGYISACSVDFYHNFIGQVTQAQRGYVICYLIKSIESILTSFPQRYLNEQSISINITIKDNSQSHDPRPGL